MFALLAATRFAHFAAMCLLFGVSAFPFYAGPPTGWSTRFDRTLRVCSVLALMTGAFELLAMAANMGDTWRSAFDRETLGAAITDTAFGRIWIGRLVLAILVVGLSMFRRPGKDWPLLVGSGLLLGSVALTGHSAIPGGIAGFAHEIADVLHLLAAGWWIGGLLALGLVAGTLGNRTVVILGRFSRIGYAAVAILIASGLMKGIVLVSSLAAISSSAYGRVLLVKLALFGAMGLLALSNRLQITPALAAGADQARWLGRLKAQIAAELTLALIILAVVGVLGSMSPPISQ